MLQLAYDFIEGASSRRAVLLLGAIGSRRDLWETQIGSLADAGLSVVAMDLRGHGDSDVPTGPYTIGELADDVLATLAHLDVPLADIVGLSLGGAVAQHIAITRPAQVATLTLIATLPRFGTRESWLARAAAIRQTGTEQIASALRGRWLTYDFCEQHPESLDRLTAMVRGTSPEGFASCSEALSEWDSRSSLGSICAPTLVLGGASDLTVTPEQIGALGASIPGARHMIIERAAHIIPVERPDVVSRLIIEQAQYGGAGSAA